MISKGYSIIIKILNLKERLKNPLRPSQLLEKKLAMCNQESTNWQDTPIIAVTCSDLMAEPRDKLACICKNISVRARTRIYHLTFTFI